MSRQRTFTRAELKHLLYFCDQRSTVAIVNGDGKPLTLVSIADLAAFALAQQRTIAKLRKALEPFANAQVLPNSGGAWVYGVDAAIKRARRLLAPRAKRGAR